MENKLTIKEKIILIAIAIIIFVAGFFSNDQSLKDSKVFKQQQEQIDNYEYMIEHGYKLTNEDILLCLDTELEIDNDWVKKHIEFHQDMKNI